MAWFKHLLGAPKIFANKTTDDGTGAVIQVNGSISENGALLSSRYAAKSPLTPLTAAWPNTLGSPASSVVSNSVDLTSTTGLPYFVSMGVTVSTSTLSGTGITLYLETASDSGFTTNLASTKVAYCTPAGDHASFLTGISQLVVTSSTIRYARLKVTIAGGSSPTLEVNNVVTGLFAARIPA